MFKKSISIQKLFDSAPSGKQLLPAIMGYWKWPPSLVLTNLNTHLALFQWGNPAIRAISTTTAK